MFVLFPLLNFLCGQRLSLYAVCIAKWVAEAGSVVCFCFYCVLMFVGLQ